MSKEINPLLIKGYVNANNCKVVTREYSIVYYNATDDKVISQVEEIYKDEESELISFSIEDLNPDKFSSNPRNNSFYFCYFTYEFEYVRSQFSKRPIIACFYSKKYYLAGINDILNYIFKSENQDDFNDKIQKYIDNIAYMHKAKILY